MAMVETSKIVFKLVLLAGCLMTMINQPSVHAQDYLAFANRRFIHRLELGTFSLSTLYTDTTKNFIAFDYDHRRGYQYWTQVVSGPSGSIFRSNLQGGEVTTIIRESLDVPDGLAIDWLTNKLYWSEATPETISVLDLERGHRRTLFSLPESSIPRGIALDPMRGLMFWTDWGSPAKVERAYMDGTGRTTIADTNLVWPNDITIDYESQLLYWVDAGLDNVESAAYDGSNRQLLVSSGVFHPFSITFYNNVLYWTDWQADAIYSKTSSSSSPSVVYSGLSTEPMGIEAISLSRQTLASTPCDVSNGNCEQLCLLSIGRTARCACIDGYTLASDGVTCTRVPDYLVFANRQFIHRLELSTFSLRTLYTDTTKNFIAFDYDYRRGLQYWTDVYNSATGSIYKSTLEGERFTTVIGPSLHVPDGLAVDWLTNKLYWSEATPDSISVVDLERGHRRTLISLSTSSIPRGIALDPINGLMFWTDWGSPAKVERAYMDGTGRTTIADTNLVWPNDITIDYESQLLYWVDASLDKIESARYDGSDRQLVVSSGVFHPFSITFFNNTLYWTDWQADAVFMKFTGSSTFTNVYGSLSTEPMGIEVLSMSRQSIATTPCDVANGNCEQLCLLSVERTARCTCADGYILDFNERNCTAIAPVTTAPPSTAGSCRSAGFTDCCLGGNCLGLPGNCFCDSSCEVYQDCCQDFSEICSAHSCASLSSIPNGVITYDPEGTGPFDTGTTATYSCSGGFYLSGASTRTCTRSGASGYWGGIEPECLAIVCTSLAAPTNGLVSYGPDSTSPYDYLTTATYSCNGGFGLFGGNRTRRCVSSSLGAGGWSGSPPVCGTITCPTLSPPTNGQVVFSIISPFISGTVATYSCDEGYTLSGGGGTRTCGGDGSSTTGEWTGAVPTCDAITCSSLTNPPNGMISFSPFSSSPYAFGTTATYSCSNGFGLNGGIATRTCGGDGSSSTGMWSSVVPSCGAITCSSLSSINNGVIAYSPDTSSPFDFGTTATHTCNSGYFLVGDNTRTCGGDGSIVDGVWSGSAPVCAAVMCPVLPAIDNGFISYSEESSSSVGFMETATYSCNSGYGLSGGDTVRTCTGPAGSSGEWSGTAPVCQTITCPSLNSPTNGQVSYSLDSTSPYNFGTVATFTCNTGFGLDGSMTRTCGGDGSSPAGVWGGASPVCNAYICSSLPSIANGVITYGPDTSSPFNYGTTATYSCTEGFYLRESSVRTCTGTGSMGFWDGMEPECLAITCTSLAAPTNGLISYGPDTTSPYDYLTTATYSCNDGFGLFGGDSSRQCMNSSPGDQGWSGTAPTCEAIICPTLSSPINGRVTFSSNSPFAYGTVATYSCDGGYGVNGGDMMRTCGGDGSSTTGVWTGTVLTCKAITCLDLTDPTNGMITFSSSPPYGFGSTASYSCSDGYGLNGGDATRTCGGDGSSSTGVWSGVVASCGAVTCSSLSSINNGVTAYSPDTSSPFNFGTTATHTCNSGYFLVGDNTRTCGGDGSIVDGVWSGSAPVCAAVMCPVLPAIDNGFISYSEESSPSVGFMETATYSCNSGYGLSGGDTVRTCTGVAGSSGQWSGTAPVCQAITCFSLTPPVNGQVSYSLDSDFSYDFETVATFTCNTGFGLDGNMTRICGGDGSSTAGVWSGAPPVCNPYTCNSLPAIPNGAITYDPDTSSPFYFGTTATFSCNEGFYFNERSVRTCTGIGSTSFWDGIEPECYAIVCTSLAAPTNGFISYGPDTNSPYDYLTTATYICNIGFGLFGGDSSRQCMNSSPGDQGWSGTAPTCEAITCPTLSPPTNGRVVYSAISYGTVATYSCDVGYAFSGGGETRTCEGDSSSSTGVWSGAALTCTAITCTDLIIPPNGVITFSSPSSPPYKFGITARYSCSDGYGLSGGDSLRTCGGDSSSFTGFWSGITPSCQVITCLNLMAPENGVITYSENTGAPVRFMVTATYSCNAGYGLSGGDQVRTCTGIAGSRQGEWTGTTPNCQVSDNEVSSQVAVGAGAGAGSVIGVGILVIIVILLIALIVALRRHRNKSDDVSNQLMDDQDNISISGHSINIVENPLFADNDGLDSLSAKEKEAEAELETDKVTPGYGFSVNYDPPDDDY